MDRAGFEPALQAFLKRPALPLSYRPMTRERDNVWAALSGAEGVRTLSRGSVSMPREKTWIGPVAATGLEPATSWLIRPALYQLRYTAMCTTRTIRRRSGWGTIGHLSDPGGATGITLRDYVCGCQPRWELLTHGNHFHCIVAGQTVTSWTRSLTVAETRMGQTPGYRSKSDPHSCAVNAT